MEIRHVQSQIPDDKAAGLWIGVLVPSKGAAVTQGVAVVVIVMLQVVCLDEMCVARWGGRHIPVYKAAIPCEMSVARWGDHRIPVYTAAIQSVMGVARWGDHRIPVYRAAFQSVMGVARWGDCCILVVAALACVSHSAGGGVGVFVAAVDCTGAPQR